MIEPTVQGTKNLLAAVTKDDTVKNLVIVASVAPLKSPTTVYDASASEQALGLSYASATDFLS